MQYAEKTKGSFSHISLEFLSCFQPLSHPRYARLTAPLDNGSQGGAFLHCLLFPYHAWFFEVAFNPSVILALLG